MSETCGGYHKCCCGYGYECGQPNICQMPRDLDGICPKCWQRNKFTLGWDKKQE